VTTRQMNKKKGKQVGPMRLLLGIVGGERKHLRPRRVVAEVGMIND
jgi:hypothetical protein